MQNALSYILKFKSYILFSLSIILVSCSNDKIFDKRLKNKEIEIDWYHYSYISSSSPNYVVVRKGAREELIFEYGWGLQDIELKKDTITILHLKLQTKPTVKKDSVFGYLVSYKEVTSHEMYTKSLKEN